jgi:hypothetical protein
VVEGSPLEHERADVGPARSRRVAQRCPIGSCTGGLIDERTPAAHDHGSRRVAEQTSARAWVLGMSDRLTMKLVWPSREHLPSYVDALERGWLMKRFPLGPEYGPGKEDFRFRIYLRSV